MSFLKRLFGGREDVAPKGTEGRDISLSNGARQKPRLRVAITHSMDDEQDLVQLSGTTTFAREAIAALAERHGIAAGGYLECDGTL